MTILFNNIRALGIHVVITIAVFIITAVDFNNDIFKFFLAVLMLLILFVYIWLGKTFLKKQKSIVLNLLSVSFVAIIGLVISAYTMLSASTYVSFYELYFSYSGPVLSIPSSTDVPWSNSASLTSQWLSDIAFSITPSVFMWIGLELSSLRRLLNCSENK